MSMKMLLLFQIAGCEEEMNWTIPMKTALEGLTPEQAAWGSTAETHSIWQIVNHLIFWNQLYLHRFLGTPVPGYTQENEATFDHVPNETDWQDAAERVQTGLSAWRDALQHCDESDLHKHVIYKNDTESEDIWWSVIANLAAHNAYHIGQIIQIRKQYGIWNNRL
jgi:uncharacterized damage-inducible protein DinB